MSIENDFYHAGQFIVDELRLVTTTGLEVDLITSVLGITLFEDISAMAITGSISIIDSVDLSSHGPLLGQEYLHLKIRTPFETENKSNIIDFSDNAFIVHSVSKRQKLAGGVQGFVLSFASQELVKNQRLKVTQSLTDTWSNIVKKMLTETKYLNTKKRIDLEPTSGIKKFVAPNVRPMDIIVMAMKQAIAVYKGEPTYLFYETLMGFNFRTLASLYNNAVLMEYTTFVPGTSSRPSIGTDGTVIDIYKDLQTILGYEIIANNDSLVSYRTGMYGSKLITHDIISKSYETKIYNYHDNWENETHIVSGTMEGKQDHPLVSHVTVNEEGLRVSDFPARTFMLPTSITGGVDSQHTTENNTNPYMAYDPHKWLQQRNSQMIQLENALQVNISVHGNTLINVGDKVKINLPHMATAKPADGSPFDRLYKGPFLIKKIRHDFFVTEKPKHEMSIQLVKDSLEEILEDTGPIEPSAKTTADIQEYSYT